MKPRQKNTRVNPRKPRRTHPHETEAALFWTPLKAYEDDYANPDWLVGAN